jgi:RNA-directed DNA polymerase
MKFKINTAKTKLMTPGNRQTVTGIVVNEKPQVVFHKRNELRQAMYYIQKFGIDEHQNTEKLTKELLEHLLGRIIFVLQINPKDTEFIGINHSLLI